MSRYSINFRVGIFFLAFSFVVGCLLIPSIDENWKRLNVVGDDFFTVGPRFFPIVLTISLGAISLVLAIAGWTQGKRESINGGDYRAVAVTILLGGFYVTILPWLGVVVPTWLFLAAFFAYFGMRGWFHLVFLPAGSALLLFWVFGKLLLAPLPPELWERF